MRADRLLSILLLLQNRKKLTAQDLAEELEVSERTIYRDIDALCTAGVPVTSESGHGGGYGLMEDYRTQLTGLKKDELRALMTLGSFAPLSELGMSDALRAALIKISAALPSSSQTEDQRIRQCFHFDSTWWQQNSGSSPHLQVLQDALWQDRKVQITYRTYATYQISHRVSPYGLVVKAGRWYLVYARQEAVFVQRVSELLDVILLDDIFSRPAEFELVKFWEGWCREHEALLMDFKVTLRVHPDFLPHLRRTLNNQVDLNISGSDRTDEEGWVMIKVSFENFDAARNRILGFGRGVQVIAPQALRLSVQDYAEQIVGLYQEKQE